MNFSFSFALQLAVCAPAPVTRFPGTVPGPCFATHIPLGPRPWLHQLRSRLPALFVGFTATMAGSDFHVVHRRLRPRLPDADQCSTHAGAGRPEISRSRAKSVRTCQCLRPRRAVWALALSRPSVLPSVTGTTSAPRMRVLRGSMAGYALPATLRQYLRVSAHN